MGNLESYSDKEFYEQFQMIVGMLLADAYCIPCEGPHAVLLGGQSGAGKTTLHRLLQDSFKNNVIVINGDEYRSFHPHFSQISAQYGVDAPAYTAAWAGKMVESLVDALSVMGYNLIIEGTLRTAEVPLKTAALLSKRGYAVSLALMAVKPEISLVSCQLRYEQMRIAGTEPRAVDTAHHLSIVNGIVGNLKVFEESDMFDSISLYARNEQCLFPGGEDTRRASEVFEAILFGDWTEEEHRHYAYLEQHLEETRAIR